MVPMDQINIRPGGNSELQSTLSTGSNEQVNNGVEQCTNNVAESVGDVSSDGGGEDSWEENEPCRDLFSEEIWATPRACVDHIRKQFQVDLVNLVLKQVEGGADEYTWIKVITYCRRRYAEGDSPSLVLSSLINEHGNLNGNCIEDDTLLKPVLADDPLLYSFDDLIDADDAASTSSKEQCATFSVEDRLQFLEKDLSACRGKIRELLNLDSEESRAEQKEIPMSVSSDASYYQSYENPQIHFEMLDDKVRTEIYRDAIQYALSKRTGANVLDVGCGTGILSLFAARAGANVIGVEASGMSQVARRIVDLNGFQNSVSIVASRVENLTESDIPSGKVDIIVSEWMGYGLLFESMLDSVLYARDHFLAPGGIVIPSNASLFVEGICENFEYWKNVYGFDFSPMQDLSSRNKAIVKEVSAEYIVTDRVPVVEIDCGQASAESLDFMQLVTLCPHTDATLTGILITFDCEMIPGSGLVLTTSSQAPQTHWTQTVLPLEKTYSIQKGSSVAVELGYKRNGMNPRDIDITLKLQGDIYFFQLC